MLYYSLATIYDENYSLIKNSLLVLNIIQNMNFLIYCIWNNFRKLIKLTSVQKPKQIFNIRFTQSEAKNKHKKMFSQKKIVQCISNALNLDDKQQKFSIHIIIKTFQLVKSTRIINMSDGKSLFLHYFDIFDK